MCRRNVGWLVFVLFSLVAAGIGRAAEQPDLDAIVVLNGIGGFGDVGQIEASRQVTAPGSKLGFSLRFLWEDHPGDPPYWACRIVLPPETRIQDYDTFAGDVRVESAEGGANLSLFLTESDDDRWVCWSKRLAEVPEGEWIHIEVKREAMSPWLIGNKKLEWERVGALAVEPSVGKAVFYLDNLRLLGPGGKRLEILTAADDGAGTDPSWNVPIRVPPPGVIYLPGLSRQNLLEAKAAEGFAGVLGKVGTGAFGAPAVARLRESGIETFFYSAYADGFLRFLTRRQAWEVNQRGETPNTTPFFKRAFTGYHCLAYAHPAVVEAGRQRVDALVKSGIGVWILVDYTFPWDGGPFGYAPVSVAAYRTDLAGKDEGLHIRESGKERVIHFSGYFRGYHGFYPRPANLGLVSWDAFTPPAAGESGDAVRARWQVFLALRSYEWLKLPDKTGRYFQSKGGHGVWVVPNPEDSWGSSDYVHILRSAGARNLFPEWFGNAGHLAEGTYAGVPYLREEADRSGSRLSLILETGAGGHAAPYWDWRVAYTTTYLITAVSRADDFDNDFLDESPFEHQSDPKNAGQFTRYRDGVSKAEAFLQARIEVPNRPRGEILCVSERPPARACNSTFFVMGQPYNLASAFSRAHIPFDLRDSLDLERVVERYRVIAYNPMSPRVGDVVRLRRWLDGKPGRVLLTHTFVPTRDAAGFWGMERNARLGSAAGGALLGLGRIAAGQARRCTLTSARGPWARFFTAGKVIELPEPLTRCERGEALVMSDAGALVTRARVGKGEVIYLHFSALEPGNPAAAPLNLAAAQAVAAMAKVAPLCEADPDTPVQIFDVPGGKSVALWDAPTADKWEFRYVPGIPIQRYEAAGVERTVRLPAGAGRCLAYDFWADRVREVAPSGGQVELKLKDALTALYYLGADTPAFRKTLSQAQARRAKLRHLKFESVP